MGVDQKPSESPLYSSAESSLAAFKQSVWQGGAERLARAVQHSAGADLCPGWRRADPFVTDLLIMFSLLPIQSKKDVQLSLFCRAAFTNVSQAINVSALRGHHFSFSGFCVARGTCWQEGGRLYHLERRRFTLIYWDFIDSSVSLKENKHSSF